MATRNVHASDRWWGIAASTSWGVRYRHASETERAERRIERSCCASAARRDHGDPVLATALPFRSRLHAEPAHVLKTDAGTSWAIE
jgi:hypothetical protein